MFVVVALFFLYIFSVIVFIILIISNLSKYFSVFYILFIRIHSFAGDSCNIVRIGHQTLHIGTLTMAVAYRTKMTISPTQTGRDNTIMLKSDHFLKDLSPKHMRYTNYNKKK